MIDEQGHSFIVPLPPPFGNPVTFVHAVLHDTAAAYRYYKNLKLQAGNEEEWGGEVPIPPG